jgi:hypothetical protein
MQSESNIQAMIRRKVGNGPVRLFRNNVGAMKDACGRLLRFGLAKGSSDLIGWITREITPADVGQRFAQFLSLEIKAEKGKPRPDQLAWIAAVKNAGGIAGVARSVDEAQEIISSHTQKQNGHNTSEN